MMQPFLCFELIVLLSFVNGAPLDLTEDEKKAAFSALYGPEGDMKLTPRQKSAMKSRNAVPNFLQKWTNGVSTTIQGLVQQAAYHIRLMTNGCIKFVQRRNEPDYVAFVTGTSGCLSWIGKIGGRQELRLGNGCGILGTIIHEMMHAVGFAHEMNRPDRDLYIKINYPNIQTDQLYNFEKLNNGITYANYDYNSIMHYGPYAYSSNRLKTMEPYYSSIILRDPYEKNSMTYWDGYEAMRYYNCI